MWHWLRLVTIGCWRTRTCVFLVGFVARNVASRGAAFKTLVTFNYPGWCLGTHDSPYMYNSIYTNVYVYQWVVQTPYIAYISSCHFFCQKKDCIISGGQIDQKPHFLPTHQRDFESSWGGTLTREGSLRMQKPCAA